MLFDNILIVNGELIIVSFDLYYEVYISDYGLLS